MAEVVEVDKLRYVVDAIFDHISNKLGIKSIDIEENFYWNVDSQSLFKTKEKPLETDLGSLHDDWGFLREILNDEDQAVALMLVHAAPLLRYIGEKIGQ
jgi:hypothetical protein